MKKSCDWSPPSRCPLVTKLAFSPQSDLSQAPVGLVSSDPEMFTYSLVFQWKKKEQQLCLKLSNWITLPHSAHVHHLSPHFNFSLSDHLMCSVGQLEFVFGLMHWVLSSWWMETPVFHMCRRCRRLTPHAGTRQVQQLNSWLVVELIVVSVLLSVPPALRLIYFSDMHRRDRKQQQPCLFLSERLLWGFEVISWTARTVKKQACVKSSGQSRHEHHYEFIKSQDSKVRCIFRVIAAHPRHATRLGLPKNCLAILWVQIQSKIISWYLVGCNCVCRTKCIRGVRGGKYFMALLAAH